MRKIIFVTLAICFFSLAHSQPNTEKVKVFLDCTQQWLCDFDFVRTEMKMVEFVRDRFQSDVHVLITTEYSSTGGTQQRLNLLGQKRFAGMNDTLTFFSDPTATDDQKRKQLVQYLKLGLTRYIAKTTSGSNLQITYPVDSSASSGNTSPEAKKDKWHYWVYQFGASGSFNGNQNNRSNSVYGYFNADKETEEWKASFHVSADKSNSIYKDSSGETKFVRKNYNSGLTIAKSINKHWSYGLSSYYQNTLYNNIKNGFIIRPRLEFSLFPYSKFNSQRIVIQYLLGPLHNSYYDTTIYFKTSEWQVQQSINIITSFNKPWGNINLGIFWSNYFDDLSKNNLSFNGAVNWKIAKGLNFGIYGFYGLIHDQITLRKGAATRDQLLVNNRELLSAFEYNLGLGFSYRFGSISNSIVNPRFKGLNYSVNF